MVHGAAVAVQVRTIVAEAIVAGVVAEAGQVPTSMLGLMWWVQIVVLATMTVEDVVGVGKHARTHTRVRAHVHARCGVRDTPTRPPMSHNLPRPRNGSAYPRMMEPTGTTASSSTPRDRVPNAYAYAEIDRK